MTLEKLLLDKMRSRNMSLREAAREVGVSHTTISRTLMGKHTDMETLEAIARWLEVPLSSVLDVRSDTDVRNRITFLVNSCPQLESALSDLFDKFSRGDIGVAVLEEIASFIAYRLEMLNRTKKETALEVPPEG